MPTGYTAICGDKPDVTFREFTLGCARAFGACIMQRDDGLNVPLNMHEEPSPYHMERITELEQERESLKNGAGPDRYQQELQRLEAASAESATRNQALRATYERILSAVEKWRPPTPDHGEMKKFMRHQLEDSIKWDCHDGTYYQDAISAMRGPGEAAWIAARLDKIEEEIRYHQAEHAKEVQRVNGRNEWKAALVASLEEPANVTL